MRISIEIASIILHAVKDWGRWDAASIILYAVKDWGCWDVHYFIRILCYDSNALWNKIM